MSTKYKDFRYQIITQIGKISNFNQIVTLFYKEEYFLKRDNKKLTLTTILKKTLKETNRDELSYKKRSNSSSKRKDRGNNNNINNTRPQISKNPASSNYKGKDNKSKYNFLKYLRNINSIKKRH